MFNFLLNHTPLLYLTQSLWRDEAFSVLLAEHSPLEIIKLTAQDFNPPLYYLLLHFWMNLFGGSEIAIRLLSFIFHLCLVYVSYKFIKKVFKPPSFSFQLLSSVFVFLNPMLFYYAFEARMYSLLALLATASMYFFYVKKWRSYVFVSALGLWTQPFMAFVILSQFIFSALTKSITRKLLLNFLAIFLLFVPWLSTLFSQLFRSSSSWLWPINVTTVTSILGNLFTGYEGTPGGLWNLMNVVSLVIFAASLWLILYNILGRRQHVKIVVLILSWIFVPTLFVLFISIFKPLYVNRYLIFVTVAESLLITIAISLIKNSSVSLIFNTLYFILNGSLLFATVSFHQKQNIKQTMSEINYLVKPTDMILAQTPLTIFETKYYSRDQNQVFLYNPERRQIPYYLGKNLIDKMKQTDSFPFYPQRAFLIHDDASYEMVYQR